MNRNIKYKQVCRIGIFGDDDVNTTSNFQYAVGGNITNSKRMRFTLNNALNDIKSLLLNCHLDGSHVTCTLSTLWLSTLLISDL